MIHKGLANQILACVTATNTFYLSQKNVFHKLTRYILATEKIHDKQLQPQNNTQ